MGMREGDFRVDDSLLDRQYKHLQRQLHPDKFSSKSEEEKERSEEASSLVNEAFSTLKNPLKRAEYMLKLKGAEVGEDSRIDDPELLMAIMEARESVEGTDSLEELRKFSETFQQQAEHCILGITECFKDDDLGKAQELVTILKYVSRIQDAILEKL